MAQGRKTGGRTRGTPNRQTAEVKALAREYTGEAIKALVSIMRNTKAPAAARVMAAREVIDRGHGKAPQALTNPDGGPLEMLPVRVVHELHAD